MKVWIEQPLQPSTLVLAWQAPDGVVDRRRWAVGLLESSPSGATFQYLDETAFGEFNLGRSVTDLRGLGFIGYPAFAFKAGALFSEHVLEAFVRRLPPSSRTDFVRYLEYFSIGVSVPPLTLLSLTEARLPSDGFSLIDPLDPDSDAGETVAEIAGFRHESPNHFEALQVGSTLDLIPDPTNEHDPNAVGVWWEQQRIGYVNRLQAPTILTWLQTRSIQCNLIRLNGRAGAPRAYAKLTISKRLKTLAA